MLKVPCHAFPVITHPHVCYEGFYACKRCAESQTLKVHPVASKTLTQSLPQNASLEISHFPLFTSWVLWRVNTQRPHPLPAFHETKLPKPFRIHAGYVQRRALKNDAVPTLFGPAGYSGTQPVSIEVERYDSTLYWSKHILFWIVF